MSATRQQRTSRVRNVVTRSVPARVPDVLWIAVALSDTVLAIELDSNPTGLSLTGIPEVETVPNIGEPLSAELFNGSVLLHYAANVSQVDSVLYPLLDPAVRGNRGEYVSGAKYALRSDTATLEWVPIPVDGNTIDLSVNVAPSAFALGDVLGWRAIPQQAVATSWEAIGGDAVRLHFAEDVSSPSSLLHYDGRDQNIWLNGKRLKMGEVSV